MRAGILLAGTAAVCGCAGAPVAKKQGPSAFSAGVVEAKDRIEAVGVGAPNPMLPSETQRKATAREAAMTKARYDLSVSMRALILQSGITLEEAIGLDPALDDRVRRAAADAGYRTEFTPDDGCVVRLLVSKRKLGEDLGVRFK